MYLDHIVQFDFVYQYVVDSNKNEGLKMFNEIDCHNGVHVNQLQVYLLGGLYVKSIQCIHCKYRSARYRTNYLLIGH